ncbi:MAG TPA: kynureninase [Pyrinomonadaceae bacterium]|nr:kynureninase [Pyrinomonadaceae bacterium]
MIDPFFSERTHQLDVNDQLSGFRERFKIPKTESGKDVVYFAGNSLGLMPEKAREFVTQELEDWARLGVEGHLTARHPWLSYHEQLSLPMAKLIGANELETILMNSLTVNLHLMLVSFYRPTQSRRKILIEQPCFPSDRYAVLSQLRFHGFSSEDLIELKPRENEECLRTEDVLAAIEQAGDSLALVMLGAVNYYTGQFFEIEKITRAAHEVGAIAGFDLAHAAGNVPMRLHDWDVDFAVWCGYKYLNGGPGAIAGAFVHEKFAERFDLERFVGWWGHDKSTRFQMPAEFKPLRGAEGWQVSNPPILQMAAMRASLEIFDEAGIHWLRQKSLTLTAMLEEGIKSIGDKRLSIITPSNPEERGCQLSIKIREGGKKVFERMITHGVIVDWREPDVIRAAPVPLYNTFNDVYRFVDQLEKALAEAN